MSEAEAFLKAIIEQPDDLLPRLVYADWLEEQGDPRAEFIRLQCEWANRESLSAERQRELLGQIERLLHRHLDQWNAELCRALQPTSLKYMGRRGDTIEKWRYHRGFVEEIGLKAQHFLQYGEKLFSLMPLREMVLRDAEGHLEAIAAHPLIGRLQKLRLCSSGEVTLAEAQALAASKHIQQLKSFRIHGSFSDPGVRSEFCMLQNLDDHTQAHFRYLEWSQAASDRGAQQSPSSDWFPISAIPVPQEDTLPEFYETQTWVPSSPARREPYPLPALLPEAEQERFGLWKLTRDGIALILWLFWITSLTLLIVICGFLIVASATDLIWGTS